MTSAGAEPNPAAKASGSDRSRSGRAGSERWRPSDPSDDHHATGDPDEPRPHPLGDGAALVALQRILGGVLDADRAPAPVVIAPAGRFELIPLRFITVDPDGLGVVAFALAAFGRSTLSGGDEFTSEALADEAARHRLTVAELIAGCTRAHGVLDLVPNSYTVHRADRLASSAGRTVLTGHQLAAYLRLTDRFLAMFHGGDPFARFLYRG